MKILKKIEKIFQPPKPHFVGDGFRVHNFIPGGGAIPMQRMDPFIVFDYNSLYNFPPSKKQRGVGVHPHKGFETVTIAYKGKIAHHDSTGNSGVIEEGGVQWMTAAKGILHKEYHEENFSKKGGPFQMVQLWVNLPAKYKSESPSYQGFRKSDIPVYFYEGKKSHAEVISGEFFNVKGAAKTFSAVNLYNIHISGGEEIDFSLPESFNSALLVIEGSILLQNDTEVDTDNLCLFRNEGTEVKIKANSAALVLVISGEPLKESIFASGPFVMNNKSEILEAYQDFQAGKFGSLPE